jgi:2-oxoisovalerate dehydrogenase E1 component
LKTESLVAAFEQMSLIREFEKRVGVLYSNGEIPGFVHLSIGQEACAVGAIWNLEKTDVITTTHRGHGHVIAKGLHIDSMMAELFGKETGICGGRGGSMHIADPRIGIFGANGIVAAGLPIAVGAAKAFQLTSHAGVVMAFFGDGAISQGAFHESVNLAALWNLPVIFLCENNQFSEFSRSVDQHPVEIGERAKAYGIRFHSIDGNDLETIVDTMAPLIEEVRSGSGPVLVELKTLRAHGHYEGDRQQYRTPNEFEEIAVVDPLRIAKDLLLGRGVSETQIEEIVQASIEVVRLAENSARLAPDPAPESLLNFVISPRNPPNEVERIDLLEQDIAVSRSIRQALSDALEVDPTVFLAGIDVGGGNVFGLTRGLKELWPNRVLDTPISETAIMGLAVGAAMAGLRPVVELMYMDFLGVCFDQIMNQAAKLSFMTGGRVKLPLVIRTQTGSGRSSGSQHSQSLEALLAHIPGLTVVMPSNSSDYYGLLRTAIEDDNPVVFVENRLLYESKSTGAGSQHRVPIGKARIAREGSDLTIVTWSRMVRVALSAAEQLASEGIEAEVLDLRTIVPFDRDAILSSLAKTSKLLIVHDAVSDFGVGAEIAALAVSEGFWSLDAPVVRIGAPYSPAPYSPSLEKEWIPSVERIVEVARRQVAL